ncbi:MAG: hypothetical protein QOI31_1695 [Solirubrobacterales bacterium]|jgi:hypothetical protein|nr:hypothetical protein [Solirubrobacterales bacterium]
MSFGCVGWHVATLGREIGQTGKVLKRRRQRLFDQG